MRQKGIHKLIAAISGVTIIILVTCVICFWPGKDNSQNEKEPIIAGDFEEKETGDIAVDDSIGNPSQKEDEESYDSVFGVDTGAKTSTGDNTEIGTTGAVSNTGNQEIKDRDSDTDEEKGTVSSEEDGGPKETESFNEMEDTATKYGNVY